MFGSLPLIGRDAEVSLLGDWLADVAAGHGGVQLVAGPAGIGKTRLAQAIAARAERDKWSVVIGRVYAVESGVPYAVWSDALLHVLQAMDAGHRNALTRGGDWLGTICPAFAAVTPTDEETQRDGKARLLWNCAQFFGRLAEKQPVLVILENLHLADSASLELLHFIGRQLAGRRIALLGTYNEAELERNPQLRDVEQSLLALGVARLIRLEALSQPDVERLVCQVFGVDHAAAKKLALRLFSWTRGHPYFIEETLKSLVEAGRLYQRDGRWLGWENEELHLPRSIRSAVTQRLEALGPNARVVAGAAAVLGARMRFDILHRACELPKDASLAAIDELCRASVLEESPGGSEADYEFSHPIIQDVLYDSLGVARARILHSSIARVLEASYGANAEAHADVLAFHYSRADNDSDPGKAAMYLAAAGRDALARHADRAAADYLNAALDRQPKDGADESLIDDLAQARQRLGDYDASMALWHRARVQAEARGDLARRGRVERRMGLACYWSGRFEEALANFDAALSSATQSGDEALAAQVRLNRGTCWQSLGNAENAEPDLVAALAAAEKLGDRPLLARAHRALLFLHTFLGPPEAARAHGERAVALAEEAGDKTVAWSAYWGLATHAGLTGDAPAALRWVARAEQIADQLQSPLLRIYTDEVSIEYAFGSGNWDDGIALAEQTISTARALNQRTLLPRLLVWATYFYSARGDTERAKSYLDEAWRLAGAQGGRGKPMEVHSQVPAYAGLANYHLSVGEYARAVEIGEQGLEIADRSGYVAWAIHRLIPVIAEAAMWAGDTERATRLRDRLRTDCLRQGHRLGLVWVDAADGLIARLRGDYAAAAQSLEIAAENLEAIPWVFDAARLRRWLADVLMRLGDADGAARELRRSHDACTRLGARVEADRARLMMKELGIPLRSGATRRLGKLTERELDIATRVTEGWSNKEIGAALGISTRTVSTHVERVFAKLGITSRRELAEQLKSEVNLSGRVDA